MGVSSDSGPTARYVAAAGHVAAVSRQVYLALFCDAQIDLKTMD